MQRFCLHAEVPFRPDMDDDAIRSVALGDAPASSHVDGSKLMSFAAEEDAPDENESEPAFDPPSSNRKSTIPSLPPVLAPLPLWKKKLHEKTHRATALVKESQDREAQARLMLKSMKVQAQRQLSRAQSEASLAIKIEANRQTALAIKIESRRLIGLDVTDRMKDTPDPTEDDIKELSVLFNEQLAKHYAPDDRSFFKLFKEADLDGSHRISYMEVEKLARHALHISVKQLPPARLDMLWKAMDKDHSGFIDAGGEQRARQCAQMARMAPLPRNPSPSALTRIILPWRAARSLAELSRFTKIGKPKTLTPVQLARLKLQAERDRQAAAERTAADRRQEMHTIKKQLQVEPASREELEQLSAMFSKALAKMKVGHVNVHKLFLNMDRKESGKVTIEEFQTACREDLHLSTNMLPEEKLWRLWRALDENENGFICAGEWGRFMRAHAPAGVDGGQVAATAPYARALQAHEVGRTRETELWALQTAQRSNELARSMEDEAARLQAILDRASNRLLKPIMRSIPALLAEGAPEPSATPAADGAKATLSPQRSSAALKKLEAEITRGVGNRRRVSPPRGATDKPMLRSFAREEGQDIN